MVNWYPVARTSFNHNSYQALCNYLALNKAKAGRVPCLCELCNDFCFP
nr:MAG TPA: hypothetical protein [Caudoviricetes sp.]